MNVALITLEGSRYGLRLLNALARQGRAVALVIVLQDDLRRRLRLLRRVARQLGVRDAAILAVERLLAEARARRVRVWRGSPLEIEYGALAQRVVRVRSLHDPTAAEAVKTTRIDVVLLGQSGVVAPAFLDLPRIGTLNAHPGWLPDYRGLDSALWAIVDERFDKVGSTLHIVDAGIDTGPVVARRPYRWRGDETIHDLEARLYDDCVDLLLEGVDLAAAGRLAGESQTGGRYHALVPRGLRKVARRHLADFLAGRAE